MKKIIRKSKDKEFECMCGCVFLTDEYETKDNFKTRRENAFDRDIVPATSWAVSKCPECEEDVKVFI